MSGRRDPLRCLPRPVEYEKEFKACRANTLRRRAIRFHDAMSVKGKPDQPSRVTIRHGVIYIF